MSDSDTTDSDCGVRFKTTSTRNKESSSSSVSSIAFSSSLRNKEPSSRHDRDRTHGRRRSRTRSRERRRHSDKDFRRRSRSKSRSTTRSTKPTTIRNIKSPELSIKSKVFDIAVSAVALQENNSSKDDLYKKRLGPILPPAIVILDDEDDVEIVGPALPPHMAEKTEKVIGPTLPSNIADYPVEPFEEPHEDKEYSSLSEEDDVVIVGPMPGTSNSKAHLELEQRALELKINKLESNQPTTNSKSASREDWMLELPSIRTITDLGLGARQFRTREKLEIGDRTGWTDLPSDRERKINAPNNDADIEKEKKEEEIRRLTAIRDEEQANIAKKHKKKHKRDKTLLEIHQKKLKKEMKEKEKTEGPIRRPFDRNLDLAANRFDEAQKKAIFKKAQLLDTRFSSGGAKFL